MSNSRPTERHITHDAGTAPSVNERRITRPHSNTSTRMPFLTTSVSGPTTIGKRSLPLQDSSFRSDVSFLSLSSAAAAAAAADNRYRCCSSCSYRNSDIRHANCALCGHELASRAPENDYSQQEAAKATSQGTIFTIDSSITLFSNPNSADPCLSVNSLTACSRTTRNSSSTKVMSNCCDGPSKTNKSRGVQKNSRSRRPSHQDEEEDGGCIQPPSVTHCQTPPRLGRGSSLEEYEDHDDASFSSEDTERCSNHSSLQDLAVMCDTSSESTENLSCVSSLNSQVSRRKVPHDDPIEASPRQGRRSRRPLVNAHGDGIPSVAVVTTTSATHPQPRSMDADEGISVACSRSSRTKKSIKNYTPGLLLRRKRRPSREDVSGAPPTPPTHSCTRKMVTDEGTTAHSRENHSGLAFPGDYQHDINDTWLLHHRPH